MMATTVVIDYTIDPSKIREFAVGLIARLSGCVCRPSSRGVGVFVLYQDISDSCASIDL
jgi:hypothetical protein